MGLIEGATVAVLTGTAAVGVYELYLHATGQHLPYIVVFAIGWIFGGFIVKQRS